MKSLTIFALLAASTFANASEPKLSLDVCIDQAAQYHRVNPKVLKAIVFQESSGRHWVVTKNKNNSYDFGASGINSIHLDELSKFGITATHLLDGCTNVYVGAWKYSKKVAKHGNTWAAVGAYHSETPERRDSYSAKIQSHLRTWGYLPVEFAAIATYDHRPTPQ
jgi:soluble lytic murein transglycosylase-like protein